MSSNPTTDYHPANGMGSRDSLTMNTKMKEGYMQFQCVGKCDMHFTSTVCVVKAKQKNHCISLHADQRDCLV